MVYKQTSPLAPSTAVLLNGKSPSVLHPALADLQQQQKLIRRKKSKEFPHGTGFGGQCILFRSFMLLIQFYEFLSQGVWYEFEKQKKKPVSQQYIHRITTTNSGRRVIFTLLPDLIKLIHEVKQIAGDGTFKRVEGEFDEYEITIWHEVSSRSKFIYHCL
jgi:hypothetical protein